jgi:4'-phosphopantetheinyl transferase
MPPRRAKPSRPTSATNCPDSDSKAVDVWFVDLQQAQCALAALHGVLDDAERRRAAAYLRPELGSRFTAARGVLRLVLSRYLDCAADRLAFATAEYGKPYLASPSNGDQLAPPRFNVSHSGQQAVYAISPQFELGVDVEQVRPIARLPGLVRQVCSPHEQALFQALPETAQLPWFLRVWTRKEAVSKAVGEGLRLAFREFAVCASGSSSHFPVTLPARRLQALREWTVCDLPAEHGYQAALALPGHEPPQATVRVWQVRLDEFLHLNEALIASYPGGSGFPGGSGEA